VKKVFLKPKAHKFRKEFRKIQNQWNAELLNGFSDKEKEALSVSLRKLAVNAEASFNQEHTQASNCRAA